MCSNTRLKLPVLIVVALLLGACAATPDETERPEATVEELYQEAKAAMNNRNYQVAIELFEELESRFPYGPFAEQARLETAYAYYKSEEPESAILAAERFIKMHPRHPNVDYAYYLRGLAAFEQGDSLLYRLFDQDPTQRNPQSAREAFEYFAELVERFPESRYASDAVQRMIHLRNRLAEHEMHVADYYLRRGAFLAAANRARYVVENYQRTTAVADALAVMVKAYQRLEQPELARDALRVLELNHPGHPALSEARGALRTGAAGGAD